MASGTTFGFNFLVLLFLLVPGYAALRGYYKSTAQIDDLSRLDKILITVIAGIFLAIISVLMHRFGVFYAVLEAGSVPYKAPQASTELGYDPNRAVTIQDLGDLSALSILLFISSQTALGYVGGYSAGTFHFYRSDGDIDVEKDLEQPWETAVRQSAIKDPVTVITKDESDEIEGRIYRIGSPSEDFDLLLSGAKLIRENDDPKPLGMTYLHYRDISQVRFRDMMPEPKEESGNWFFRTNERIRSGLKNKLEGVQSIFVAPIARIYYRRKIMTAVQRAENLKQELNSGDGDADN